MQALLFVAMNAAALLASALLALRLFSDDTVRILGGLCLFPLLALLTLLLLGLLNLLSAPAALLVVAALAAALAAFRRGTFHESAGAGEARAPGTFDRAGILLLVLAAAPLLARAVLSGPHLSIDDLKYHAPVVTWWMLDGGFTAEHSYYYYAYYPFNAELLALWFVLPFGLDGFATHAGAYWTLLLGAALIVLMRSAGRSPGQAFPLLALVFSLSIIPVSVFRYAAVDMAGVSAVAAAMALLANGRPGRPATVLAGALCGFAIGTKLIFAPAALVLAGWTLSAPATPKAPRARLGRAALFLAGTLLTGSFWYLRNLVLTGNPIFPADFGPFAGAMPPEHFEASSLAGWLLSGAGAQPELIGGLLLSHVAMPVTHFVAIVAGVAALGFSLLSGRLLGPERGTAVLVLLVVLASLAGFVFMPASGPEQTAAGAVEIKNRFLILPAVLSLLCLGLVLTRSDRYRPVYLAIAALGVLAAWGDSWTMLLGLAAASFAVAWAWPRFLPRSRGLRRWSPLLILVLLLGLGLWQPAAQRLTDRRVMERSREHAQVWYALGAVPPGERIAALGPASRLIYPLFGRDLSLRPLVVRADGTPRRPLHSVWKDDPGRIAWHDPLPPAGEVARSIDAVRAAGIRYLYLSWNGSGRPGGLHGLERSGILAEDSLSCLLWLGE